MAPESEPHQLLVAVIGGDPAVRRSLISHSTEIQLETNQKTHPDYPYDHVHLIDISELDTNPSEQPESAGKVFRGIIIIRSGIPDDGRRITAVGDVDWIEQVRSTTRDTYTVLVNPSQEMPEHPQGGLVQEGGPLNGIPVFRYNETRASAMAIFSNILSQARRTNIQNALDAKTDRTVNGDNDSAKAGLESTDDGHNTIKLDLNIIYTRERHMKSLAEMCKQIERTARDQHMEIESVFRGEIDSLEKTIKGGEDERHKLVQILHQKDSEIDRLRGEVLQANESHKHQLEEQRRQAQEELSRAEERHRQEKQEDLARAEERYRNQSQEELSRAEERYKQEKQEALAALRVEMTTESEKRVSNLLEEMGREAEERVNKVRAEMSRMQADFDKEREQTMKEMKSEMVRLADREREAREKSRRAEMAQRSDEYRQSLQTWAIARLWGVGQARAR